MLNERDSHGGRGLRHARGKETWVMISTRDQVYDTICDQIYEAYRRLRLAREHRTSDPTRIRAAADALQEALRKLEAWTDPPVECVTCEGTGRWPGLEDCPACGGLGVMV